jgi:dCTP deaminase
MISGEKLPQTLASPDGVVVTPIIDPDSQIGEASVDIRLGPDIIVSRRATGATSFDPIDAHAFRDALRRRQAYVRRGLGDPFHLQPGEFVIARSLEYVQLPAGVRAQALGRSSWGRLGLVVATATLIQPGFRGTITLELTNLGNTPIVLEIGLPIAQLTFTQDEIKSRSPWRARAAERARRERVRNWWQLSQKRRKKSRYTGQLRPALSRLHADPDLWWVSPIAVKCAVGIVGERFSGKSFAANFLVSRRNFRIYRLTQFIYEEALRRGEDVTDHAKLRRLGDEMREQWGQDVLARLAFSRIRSELLDPDRSRPPAAIVIEGFKVPEELEAWQKVGFFKALRVDADPLDRLRRAQEAGLLKRELEQEPLPENDSDKIDWLRRTIDEPADGRHLTKPLLEHAAADEQTITVPNFEGLEDLSKVLGDEVDALEVWARGRPF